MSRREEEMNEQEEEPAPAPVGYGLDVEGFIQGLEQLLNNNAAGYSIGLNENGSTIASATGGLAKWPQDGSEAWTLDTRMFVASLNKIVTAIAMTRLLVEAGISPDTPIIGYLPAYWLKGNNVGDITIADLLNHTSGLAFNDTTGEMDYPFMKAQIALGIERANLGTYQYQDVNYGLCRVLLATINGNVPPSLLRWPTYLNDNLWDSSTISAYASYVASEVFAPSGVSGPDFTHDPADALAYNFPVTGHGWNSLDQTEQAAFHMSVNELLKVMGTFRRGGTIVSPVQAQLMLDNGFGLNSPLTNPPTPAGPYYVKLGGLHDNEGHEEQCLAFFLPLNMELVVLVNSPIKGETIGNGPTGDLLYQEVSAAYRNSIVHA
jgi:Beta-lactamase